MSAFSSYQQPEADPAQVEPAAPSEEQAPEGETPPVDSALDGTAADTVSEMEPQETPALDVGDSAIAEVFAVENLTAMGLEAWEWVQVNILTINTLIQVGLLFAAFIPAIIFGPKLRRLIQRHVQERVPAGILRRAVNALGLVATLIALWITLAIFMGVVGAFGYQNGLLAAARSLLLAAIFIRLVTLVIRSPFWSKVAFYVAWPVAALDALGVLDNVVAQLEAASVTLIPASGDEVATTLSALDIVRAGIIFAILFWLASVASSLLNRRLQSVEELNPSFRALLEKVLNLALPVIALVLALHLIGFNLASLAVFSGAVGLGIGLGLQKIVSNFLAGFTLLADKSIKPGDVIDIDGVYGWITEMKSRYVAVRTRDGHAHLIPNASFIDNGVVNWSHGNDKAVRIKAGFGVTYNQRDMRKVQEIALEATNKVDRVLAHPPAVCLMTEYGDSSVNFEIRCWINDPANGVANVRSQVLLNLWDALADADIEIPFPQRDLHIRSSSVDFGSQRALAGEAE